MQELHPESHRSRELAYFYARCRWIGWLKKLATLPWGTDCHSQCAHWLRNDATRNRLTRRCVLLPTFPAGGKVGRRRPFPTKEKHPSERKRKPTKRERIPTTSLRTGLGMTGLAYERIFSSPIKSTLPCTVSLRGNRRSAACGG